MTPVFGLCDQYVTRLAALDPVSAGMLGLAGAFGPATDYGPDGVAARAELVTETLAALELLTASCEADRIAAAFLRERLEAQRAWNESREPFRQLRAPFGLISALRDSVDLLPRDGDDAWRNIAARLAAIPGMFTSWRASLETGLSLGLPAARRQAVEAAIGADRCVSSHDALVASYGDGPLAAELAAAAAQAYQGYAETARYLREDYAPRASEVDSVGRDRYAVGARLSLGADIDLDEAYEWGWAELRRIQDEMRAEADRIKPGASVEEATAILNESGYVTGDEAYLNWLQDRHDWAIEQLDGVHFDIPAPLRTIEVVLARGSTSGAAYYTGPSEDLTRPGRTWWPLGGRDPNGRFQTWSELSTVFHEGVPGHHLQVGAAKTAGDALSRFAKTNFVSGHGEGWALYAERLADELGWFTQPGTRLGMLGGSALRAARVVIDIGVHLDLPLPDGSRWTFDRACEVLRTRGRGEPHQIHAEVVRYFGWPGQAISYKLGERGWLAARAEAMRRPDFDLKRWHTAALSLGPIGLADLAEELGQRLPAGVPFPGYRALNEVCPGGEVFAAIREEPGNVSVKTIGREAFKLGAIGAVGLPDGLFVDVAPRVLAGWRARVAADAPSHLRSHPHEIMVTLLAAYLYCRQREITDALADLLIATVHRINARADAKVTKDFVAELKRVSGKENILFKMTEAALQSPGSG